jgi:hypothetical protein
MRARVKTFQSGFSIQFEPTSEQDVKDVIEMRDAIKKDFPSFRVSCLPGWSLYAEPQHATPEDHALRTVRKRQVKNHLKACGFDVVAESQPIAGQVR